MQSLAIANQAIRQIDGLYSLNDLHKSAGGEPKHQPALFQRLESTQALVAEIHSTDSQSALKSINGGRYRGTYACRELVIAYAAWISAAFHLKVIRVFLSASDAQLSSSATLTPAQAHAIKSAVEAKCKGESRAYSACYHALYDAFKVPSYKAIPATRFDAALAFVQSWQIPALPSSAAPQLVPHCPACANCARLSDPKYSLANIWAHLTSPNAWMFDKQTLLAIATDCMGKLAGQPFPDYLGFNDHTQEPLQIRTDLRRPF